MHFSQSIKIYWLLLKIPSQNLQIIYWRIVIRNWEIVSKHGPLEISGVAVQSIHQNCEEWQLFWGIAQWKWLWDCFSHFLLLWPWCHGFWGSSEDRYRSKRVLQMLIVCYYLLNSQNISINNKLWKRLVPRTPPT